MEDTSLLPFTLRSHTPLQFPVGYNWSTLLSGGGDDGGPPIEGSLNWGTP